MCGGAGVAASAASVVWRLVGDGEDKHDKLAVQLGLLEQSFLDAYPMAPFSDTPLSRPEPDCVKSSFV